MSSSEFLRDCKFRIQCLRLIQINFSGLSTDEVRRQIWKGEPISDKTLMNILRHFERKKILVRSRDPKSIGMRGRVRGVWSRNPDTIFKPGDRVNWMHPLGAFAETTVVRLGMCDEIGPYAIIAHGKYIRVWVSFSSIRLFGSDTIQKTDDLE